MITLEVHDHPRGGTITARKDLPGETDTLDLEFTAGSGQGVAS
jgi:hypothetical protein